MLRGALFVVVTAAVTILALGVTLRYRADQKRLPDARDDFEGPSYEPHFVQPKPPRVELLHPKRLQALAELSWEMIQAQDLFNEFTVVGETRVRHIKPVPPWLFDESRIAHHIRRAMGVFPVNENLSAVARLVCEEIDHRYAEVKELQTATDITFDTLDDRVRRIENTLFANEADFRFFHNIFCWLAAEDAGDAAPLVSSEHRDRLSDVVSGSLSQPQLEHLKQLHLHDQRLETFYRSEQAWEVFGVFACDQVERDALERAKSNPHYDISRELLNVPQAEALVERTFGKDAFITYVRQTAGEDVALKVQVDFERCRQDSSIPNLQAAWERFVTCAGPAAFLSAEDLYFLEMKFIDDPRPTRRYARFRRRPVHWKRRSYWPFL